MYFLYEISGDPAAVKEEDICTCCFTVCTFIFYTNLTEIPVNGTGNATCFVEQLIDKAVGEGKISLKKRKSDDTQVNTNTFDDHIFWQRLHGHQEEENKGKMGRYPGLYLTE